MNNEAASLMNRTCGAYAPSELCGITLKPSLSHSIFKYCKALSLLMTDFMTFCGGERYLSSVQYIGICQYYNCFISLAIIATAFAFVSILMVPNA